MRKRSGISGTLLVLSGLCLTALPLSAQNYPATDDPPGRAAALSWIDGNVSFQPGGVDDWVPATLNRPLTTGDRLWTDSASRAELLLGSAAFRLGARTNFTFLNLTDYMAQVQLSSGTLSVRVRTLVDQESIEIDTPQAAFSLLQPGEYRIDVDERGDATIATVRGGSADVISGDQSMRIASREQVRVTEWNERPQFERYPSPVADAFDNWCQQRDRREDMSRSARYVSHDIPGYADLDDHGVWSEDLQYAWIWFPRVTPGWAPYRFGHWAWIEPWGWTWVDDAPWGYAPFHYGRWIFVGSAWGWVPGPVVVRPLFCPALVAWVGGPGFSLGISLGGPPVGWFPLGPREVWMPPYHHSRNYMERVNVTNTVIVNRTIINNFDVRNVNYMNRRVPGGITAVSRDVLDSGRPVGPAAAQVPADALDRAQIRELADIAPRREAVLDGRMPVGTAPPPAVRNRGVVAREAPPPAPVPFAQRQTALQSNPGRPLNGSAMDEIRQRQPQPARPAIRQVGPAAPQPGVPSPDGKSPPPPTGGRGQRFPVPQQPRTQAPAPEQPQVRPVPQPEPAQRGPAQQPTQTPPARQPELRRPAEAAPRQPQVQQPSPAPPTRQPELRRPAETAPRQPQVQQPAPALPQQSAPQAQQPTPAPPSRQPQNRRAPQPAPKQSQAQQPDPASPQPQQTTPQGTSPGRGR